MAGRKKWSDIRAGTDPERLEAAALKTAEMLREMPLHELRQARRLSQEALAQVLGTNQAGVSKMERRADMYVSTLRRYLRAMGGDLEITARFPEGSVRINQFEELSGPPGTGQRGTLNVASGQLP
jgi:DNA-binding transcriptional regulator YiaG